MIPPDDLTTKSFDDLSGANSAAIYSKDEIYRYALRRRWKESAGRVAFVMLNPSTATELQNDPTVARCQKRAIQMGYGAVEVVNIFALRSTDPKNLYKHPDPVGKWNDEIIMDAVEHSRMIVCAWGSHGNLRGRGKEVLQMILAAKREIHVLRVNDDGQPGHPLYLGYDCIPQLYELPKAAEVL